MALLERVGGQDRALVAQVTAYRAQVAEQQAELAQEPKKEQAVAAQVHYTGVNVRIDPLLGD